VHGRTNRFVPRSVAIRSMKNAPSVAKPTQPSANAGAADERAKTVEKNGITVATIAWPRAMDMEAVDVVV
jgi:hypothetical protein